jgi:hypothetical protein
VTATASISIPVAPALPPTPAAPLAMNPSSTETNPPIPPKPMQNQRTPVFRPIFPNTSDDLFATKDFACILQPVESALRSLGDPWWPENKCAQPFVVALAILHALLASALSFFVALPILLLSACYALPFEVAFAFAGAAAFATCPAYGMSLRVLGALFVFSISLLGGALAVLAAVVVSPFFALFCGFESVFILGSMSWRPIVGLHAPARALRGWVNLSVPPSFVADAWQHWRAPLDSNETVRTIRVLVWLEAIVLALLGGILGILPFVAIAVLFCIPIWLRVFILALQLPKVSCALIFVWPFAVALALALASPPILLCLSVFIGFGAGAVTVGGSVLEDSASAWESLGDWIKLFYETVLGFARGSWNIDT